MELKNHQGEWLINHPLQDLDGLENAVKNPEGSSHQIHLDIFLPQSLDKLFQLIGHDPTIETELPGKIITYGETKALRRRQIEGMSSRGRNKES